MDHVDIELDQMLSEQVFWGEWISGFEDCSLHYRHYQYMSNLLLDYLNHIGDMGSGCQLAHDFFLKYILSFFTLFTV